MKSGIAQRTQIGNNNLNLALFKKKDNANRSQKLQNLKQAKTVWFFLLFFSHAQDSRQ